LLWLGEGAVNMTCRNWYERLGEGDSKDRELGELRSSERRATETWNPKLDQNSIRTEEALSNCTASCTTLIFLQVDLELYKKTELPCTPSSDSAGSLIKFTLDIKFPVDFECCWNKIQEFTPRVAIFICYRTCQKSTRAMIKSETGISRVDIGAGRKLRGIMSCRICNVSRSHSISMTLSAYTWSNWTRDVSKYK